MTVDKREFTEAEPVGQVPDPVADTDPTQWLCGAVYIDADLRRFVLDMFLDTRLRTWPPNYGLDTTAVVRHAWRARRWTRGRDVLLGLTLITGLAVLVTRWLSRDALVPAGVFAALIALLLLARRILRWREIRVRDAYRWLRKRRESGRQLAVLAGLGLVVLASLSGYELVRSLQPGDGVVVGVVALAVVLIGTVDGFVAVGRARRFLPADDDAPLTVTALRDEAPALPDRYEERLSVNQDRADPEQGSDGSLARVLVYDLPTRRKTFVNNTFVGSGESLGPFEINIDVSRGKPGPDGTLRQPLPVDLEGLHRAVAAAAQRQHADGLWCGFRMYVDGARMSKELLPAQMGPPVAMQELRILLDRLRRPIPGERTYLCVQVPLPNWAHRIVLTLFVRADLTGDLLIVHNDILILPGPMVGGRNWPRLPTDAWTHGAVALRLGTTRIWGAAAGSPIRLLREAGVLLRRCWRSLWLREQARHQRRFAHGAVYSIREKLAEGAVIVHPDAVQDINATIAFLMLLLRNGLREYLGSRDIDTSKLDDDVKTVINNQQTKIEELHAKNATFGNNSQAGDTNQQKGDETS
jgi:hypothetical protein